MEVREEGMEVQEETAHSKLWILVNSLRQLLPAPDQL